MYGWLDVYVDVNNKKSNHFPLFVNSINLNR